MSRWRHVEPIRTLRRTLVLPDGVYDKVYDDVHVRQARRSKHGLSLVEVLLALAIMGIMLTGVIMTTSRCLAVARKAKLYENARHLIARAELENPIDREEVETGTESGSFDSPYEQYTWIRTIESIGEDEEDGMYSVALRVSWNQGSRQAFEEVMTYLYQPPQTLGGSFQSGP